MSAYYPSAQQPTRASRPGTATAGAILSLVMIGLAAIFVLIGMIAALAGANLLNHLSGGQVDISGALVVGMLLCLAVLAVPFAAAILTLKNNNAWRITLVVFAYLDTALMVLASIGAFTDTNNCGYSYSYNGYDSASNFCSTAHGSIPGGLFCLVWAALAALAGTLLLINGANEFYARNAPIHYSSIVQQSVVQGGYSAPYAGAPTAPSQTPAGWYPVDGGQLRWWDGNAWTEHFHQP